MVEEKIPASGRELAGKVALVTGASRGIGRAVVRRLAAEGYAVGINYLQAHEAARALEVVPQIEAAGGAARAIGCDVSDFGACGRMVEEIVADYGHVDILVNNAGVTRDNLVARMSEEDYDLVMDINLKGAFHTIRHLTRYFLKQRKGKIVNISSVSGVAGNAGQANYAASKAGVIGMTKSAAKELASRGITVNAVAPGFIETDMTGKLSDKVRDQASAQIPMGAFGKPEDVAKAVGFLASEDAGYITGQVIHVDGGMVM